MFFKIIKRVQFFQVKAGSLSNRHFHFELRLKLYHVLYYLNWFTVCLLQLISEILMSEIQTSVCSVSRHSV